VRVWTLPAEEVNRTHNFANERRSRPHNVVLDRSGLVRTGIGSVVSFSLNWSSLVKACIDHVGNDTYNHPGVDFYFFHVDLGRKALCRGRTQPRLVLCRIPILDGKGQRRGPCIVLLWESASASVVEEEDK
jgi:hypothetical protein